MIFSSKKCVLAISILSLLSGSSLYGMSYSEPEAGAAAARHWACRTGVAVGNHLRDGVVSAADNVVEDAAKCVILATAGYVVTEATRRLFESQTEKDLRASEELEKRRLVVKRTREALKECGSDEDVRTAGLLVELSKRSKALENQAAKLLGVELSAATA